MTDLYLCSITKFNYIDMKMECSYRSNVVGCLLVVLLLFGSQILLSLASQTHFHEFVVQETPVKRLCNTHNIVTVNGMYPGPSLRVRNGDSLVINVVNHSPNNISIHWHGVRQLRTAWADGSEFVTQCPIQPGKSYVYRFTIADKEGTLWWHAHSSWLRSTVHGAIFIYPKEGTSYPFEKPKREFPVILGEWWSGSTNELVREALRTGGLPALSQTYTINGQPGDLFNCSRRETARFQVGVGEIIHLRVINAAMSINHFFSIRDHNMTIVGMDASYQKPFSTNMVVLCPGQTADVLLFTNQAPGRYYMALKPFAFAHGVPFDKTTATAILEYTGEGHRAQSLKTSPPLMPSLPVFDDGGTADAFTSAMTSLSHVRIPGPVDVNLVFTFGLGLFFCRPDEICLGPNNKTRLAAGINNISFVLPSNFSILQAHLKGIKGVFKPNFPPVPPLQFNFTATNVPQRLWQPMHGTEVLHIKYGSVVELVFQGTSIFKAEYHPIHIHGYDFYVLAVGTGNFNRATDRAKFNLVDPPLVNTVMVPANGWAVVRFVADNPGAWFVHCHMDEHLILGLGMVIIVDNGVGELQTLGPPPADFPLC